MTDRKLVRLGFFSYLNEEGQSSLKNLNRNSSCLLAIHTVKETKNIPDDKEAEIDRSDKVAEVDLMKKRESRDEETNTDRSDERADTSCILLIFPNQKHNQR